MLPWNAIAPSSASAATLQPSIEASRLSGSKARCDADIGALTRASTRSRAASRRARRRAP
jgi:hypothetical protein